MKRSLCLITILLAYLALFPQENPLLRVQSYQLDNGLTVLLNPDSTASRVFGAVMVNAGAKHESPDATGMAHYLEHLLFKGTETMGTLDYEQEKPHLDSINRLYEQLASTEAPSKQAILQRHINEQALAASEYGLPNEFDRLLRSIGSTGINAFTNYEMTFYHNSFPAHEIECWLDLYATRFQHPVFRSFQSELEVVYEEKNRAMDNMERKFTERLREMLYPNLPYGQWSVLGTVEHLKKPSLIKMYDFFERHYVPGNMALILSGKFDAEQVKPLIQNTFGPWQAAPLPSTQLPDLEPMQGRKVEKVRMTPVKVGTLSWQTVPLGHEDRLAMDLCEYLLFNDEETGVLNQLKLNGDLMFAFGISDRYLHAGGFHLILVPKPIIQSLGSVRKKVEAAIERVKQGDIPDEAFLAAKNALAVGFQSQLESLDARGRLIGRAFNQHISWEEYLQYPKRLSAISKQEVMAVAQRYLNENRAELISRTGFGKPTKLAKPPFKPVTTDQKGQSEYAQAFEQIDPQPFAPRYLDFEEDVQRQTLPGGHQLWMAPNPLNDLFNLTISYQKGRLHDDELPLVASLLSFAGSEAHALDALKQAFSSLGCNYQVYTGNNTFTLRLSGREAALPEALALLGSWMKSPRADDKTLKQVFNEENTARKLEAESPYELGRVLLNYGLFEDESTYLTRSSLKEIKQASPAALLGKFRALTEGYQAEITFVGQASAAALAELLQAHVPLAQEAQAAPPQYLAGRTPGQPEILLIHNKKAIQSQVYFYVPGIPLDPADYPSVQAFNEYFAGGFSGLVKQEIREYRSLAYATGASYNLPYLAGERARLLSYIGCQADKTVEAIEVMHGLLQDMPLKPERVPNLRKSLQMKVITQFPDFREIPGMIQDYERQGFTTDPNRAAYTAYESLDMEMINAFYEKAIKDRPYLITIFGDTRRMDLQKLNAYGKVRTLRLKEILR